MFDRHDFPWLCNNKEYIYFDNASTVHKPNVVIDAMANIYQHEYAPTYRSMYQYAEQMTMRYEQARQQVAQCIEARDACEIIFTKGATEGVNLVAYAWALHHIAAGDVIVLSQLEHHANLLPWQYVAQQTGAQLRFIPVNADGTLDLTSLDSLMTPKVKLVSVIAVSNALGTHNNLEKISTAARAVGAKFFVDACQMVPHQAVSVQKLACDFFVFSGHKMMAPTGIGVLYIAKEIHDQLSPYQRGGGMVREVTYEGATWADMPKKFEAGTPPFVQAIGLGQAIDYYKQHVDFDALQTHEARLCAAMIDGLSVLPGVRVLGPIEELKRQGHVVSFAHEYYHPHDIAAYLDAHGIGVRAGHLCAQPFFMTLNMPMGAVRASFYGYNTLDEVEYFLHVMRKLLL